MVSCIFPPLRSKLLGSENLRKLYQDLEPTCETLVAIMNSKPENEAGRECLHYFKKYVKSLDKTKTFTGVFDVNFLYFTYI